MRIPYPIPLRDAPSNADTLAVATVLILEPDEEVRSLYERTVTRVGYTPAFDADDGDADVVIVEPGSPPDLAVARMLREERPGLPVVCASIFPAQSFGLGPVVFIEKPFRLATLERVLRAAVDGVTGANGLAALPVIA